MKEFVPFHDAQAANAIVIDANHPQLTVLSHWKGANTHADLKADTSTEIALNAIYKQPELLNSKAVTASHFDIDGFIGVYALLYPEQAKKYSEVFIQMALIGDFREYNPKHKDADLALKLCSWINAKEKELFYEPFGRKDEVKSCINKFHYFLIEFPKVLANPDKYSSIWEAEYLQVKRDYKHLQTKGKLETVKGIKMSIRKADRPLHYYALFSQSDDADIIFSAYPNNCYELEYKYTTWIDLGTRLSFPRIKLKPLANRLNNLEKSGKRWYTDSIKDTGPILRLGMKDLSKAERFAHPYERHIHSSSISFEIIKECIIGYFQKALKDCKPKLQWSWKETDVYNQKIID